MAGQPVPLESGVAYLPLAPRGESPGAVKG